MLLCLLSITAGSAEPVSSPNSVARPVWRERTMQVRRYCAGDVLFLAVPVVLAAPAV